MLLRKQDRVFYLLDVLLSLENIVIIQKKGMLFIGFILLAEYVVVPPLAETWPFPLFLTWKNIVPSRIPPPFH